MTAVDIPEVNEPDWFDPNQDTFDQTLYQRFYAEADNVAGFDLVSHDLMESLIKVPFGITRMVFRPGITQAGRISSYVSLECMLADGDTLAKKRIDPTTLPWAPEDQIVVNDGSTGIYRQAVAYCAAKGYISLLTDDAGDIVENGAKGESTYDLPADAWAAHNAGKVSFDLEGRIVYSVNVRLNCPRGIRVSKYDWEGQEAATYYLS